MVQQVRCLHPGDALEVDPEALGTCPLLLHTCPSDELAVSHSDLERVQVFSEM